jgi:hypothetical protein
MRKPATRFRKPPVKEINLHMSAAAFIRRAWPEHLPWSHFPAGEKRDARTAGKLRNMGLAPGWPDFVFLLPRGQVAFIELKTRTGDLSEAQAAFCERVKALGQGYAVCRSLEEVETTLARWLACYGLSLRARTMTRAA